MSTLQFVFGASGSGKTEFCIRKALEEAGKDLNHNVYYLVPEQDTLAMQKRIVSHEENQGKGILNVDVLSFQRLYYRAFENTNHDSSGFSKVFRQEDANGMVTEMKKFLGEEKL